MTMMIDSLPFLRLLQLADTALPIGAIAHSWGVESLTAESLLTPDLLPSFLKDYLQEIGRQDAIFCRLAHQAAQLDSQQPFEARWVWLNQHLSALKQPQESRDASATLGKRFLQLAGQLFPLPMLEWAYLAAQRTDTQLHHVTTFGLSGALIGVDEELTTFAYLHQSLANLLSIAQRLMAIGQRQAATLLWELKPTLVDVVAVSRNGHEDFYAFTPLLDIASMRHPHLKTRLFIS